MRDLEKLKDHGLIKWFYFQRINKEEKSQETLKLDGYQAKI